MINEQTFKEITYGLAHESVINAYYTEVLDFIEQFPDHQSISIAVQHKRFIEEKYSFNSPQKELPEKPKPIGLNDITESVKQQVDKIINRDLSATDLQPVLNFVSQDIGWRSGDLTRYYHARKEELEENEFKSEIDTQLHDILSMSTEDIDLADFLPEWLSQPLKLYCENTGNRQSVAMSALVSTMSALHHVSTRLLVDPSKNWYEPPNTYGLVVSPTGQGKSPVITNLVQTPLARIQSQWKKEYEAQREEYEMELEDIKHLPKEERSSALREISTPPDRAKICYATDPTVIGLNGQFNAYPNQGILAIYDEATKLFAFDRTGSSQSDKADLLSYYNGGGISELRKDGLRANVEKTLLSIFGTIQPFNLLELMGNCADPSGQWARFMITIQPLQRKTPSRHLASVDISDFLTGLYRAIMERPETLYSFSEQAGKTFDDYLYGEMESKRLTTNELGLAALYGKTGGKVARLALNLHVLETLITARTDTTLIYAETVEKAIALDRFFTNQARVMYSQAKAIEGELPAKLALICERSQQVGAITAREVRNYLRAFKQDDVSKIREYFKKLESFGRGRCLGYGNRMKFTVL